MGSTECVTVQLSTVHCKPCNSTNFAYFISKLLLNLNVMTRLCTCVSSSLCFLPDTGLELRYLLRLITETLQATTIPEVTCNLGKVSFHARKIHI